MCVYKERMFSVWTRAASSSVQSCCLPLPLMIIGKIFQNLGVSLTSPLPAWVSNHNSEWKRSIKSTWWKTGNWLDKKKENLVRKRGSKWNQMITQVFLWCYWYKTVISKSSMKIFEEQRAKTSKHEITAETEDTVIFTVAQPSLVKQGK